MYIQVGVGWLAIVSAEASEWLIELRWGWTEAALDLDAELPSPSSTFAAHSPSQEGALASLAGAADAAAEGARQAALRWIDGHVEGEVGSGLSEIITGK